MNNAPNTIVVKIGWISLIVSQCIYLGLPVPEAAGGRDDLPMLAGALAFVALSEAVGAFAWFRIGAVGRIQGGHIDPSSVEGAGQLLVVVLHVIRPMIFGKFLTSKKCFTIMVNSLVFIRMRIK